LSKRLSITRAVRTVWSVSGVGAIDKTKGSGTTLTARLTPGTTTVTAQVASAPPISISFTVVAPNSITVSSNVDNPPGTQDVNGVEAGAETGYYDYISPTNVSFDHVSFRENGSVSYPITWPDGSTSTNFPNRTQIGLACGDSFFWDVISSAGPLIPVSYLYVGESSVDFSYGDSWTDQYKSDAGWVDFYSLNMKVEYRGSDRKCRVTYLGVPGGWQGPFD